MLDLATYDVIGAIYFDTLPKNDLVELCNEISGSTRFNRLTKRECQDFLQQQNDPAIRTAIATLEYTKSERHHQEFRKRIESQLGRQKATEREVMTLTLNNAVIALTDDQLKTVVDLAVKLQGKKPTILV